MKRSFIYLISLWVLASITCSAPGQIAAGLTGQNDKINKVIFCQDVTDAGDCIHPGTTFPAGTSTVWAKFTYQDMSDGQKWSRVWKQDGELYAESQEESWDGGKEGWKAYDLEDPNGLSGHFVLTILIDKNEVQTASFDVAATQAQNSPAGAPTQPAGQNAAGGFPAFGPITMAAGATEDSFPIGATSSFEQGIKKVFAVFPYANMTTDLTYTAEWLRDGQQVARQDYQWQDTSDGMHSTSLSGDSALVPGTYTLNLYIADQLVRSRQFIIQGETQSTQAPAAVKPGHPDRPATPDEVWDPRTIKYYDMIAQADLPVLKQVLYDNLKGWTKVIITPDNQCGAGAIACFQEGACDNRTDGKVLFPEASLNQEDFKVAEVLTHELTHGMEYYGGMKCGCTVQKEFYAFAAELDYLGYSGHRDFLENQFGLLWDSNGNVRTDRLWDVVKKNYFGPKCPEY